MKTMQEIKQEYESGRNLPDMAREYGIKYHTLYKRLRVIGTVMRDASFKKGMNSWDYFTGVEREERAKATSNRMIHNNPMFNDVTQEKVSTSTKSNAQLTHRDRRKIIEKYGECLDCGIDYALQVHHRDENKKNNVESNIIVLCANCHHIRHYGKNGDKKYAHNRKRYMANMQ